MRSTADIPPLSASAPPKPWPDRRGQPLARPWLALSLIIMVGAAIRLIGLGATTLWGDEYGSIIEASTHFGQNATSLLYSSLLHVTLGLGNSVALLRLPSALLGIAGIAAVYALGSSALDRRTGLVAAALTATSAFQLSYAQTVRFYALFFVGGVLAIQSCVLLVRYGSTRGRWLWFVAANLLCLASHILGAVIVFVNLLCYFVLSAQPTHRPRRLAFLGVLAIAGGIAVSIRQVRVWGFTFITTHTVSADVYHTSRGLHLTALAKIGWNLYEFMLGERVYPLWWWLSLPGVCVIGGLLLRGLYTHRRNQLIAGILLPQLALGLIILYLIFDSLTDPSLQGASPRYLIPLLGPMLVIVAAGVTSWRSQRALVLSVLLVMLVNGSALVAYWQNTWNYNGYSQPWPQVAQMLRQDGRARSVIFIDGRSDAPAAYYLNSLLTHLQLDRRFASLSNLAAGPLTPRVIVLASSDRADEQAVVNQLLDVLSSGYTVTDVLARFPLFAYVLARGQTPPETVQGWQPIPLPVDLYGLPLAELRLPFTLSAPVPLLSRGSLVIAPGQPARSVSLPVGPARQRLLLATSLIDDAALPMGAPIALVTASAGQQHTTIILRKGQQVDDWQTVGQAPLPASATYVTAYTWTKFFSLLGLTAYPDAHRQFTAGIAAVTLPLPSQHYNRLSIQYLAPSGQMDIWAAALR